MSNEQTTARATYRAIYQIGAGKTSQQIEVSSLPFLPFVGWEYGPQEMPDGSGRYAVCIAAEKEAAPAARAMGESA